MAENDWMVHKAENIYFLVLTEKSLPTPPLTPLCENSLLGTISL